MGIIILILFFFVDCKEYIYLHIEGGVERFKKVQ